MISTSKPASARSFRRTGRVAGFVAAAASTVLVLSACAGGGAPSTELSDEPVTLRFTWWGNDIRTAGTQEVIDAFEDEHPNITIEPQFADWAGYWDKLATETAAQDAPDIIQMDEKYIATYGQRGALLDLGTLGDAIDTSDFPASALETGSLDGAQYGIPVGLTSYAYVINPTLFEQAGVEIPDDTTWTWDDYAEISSEISAAGDGAYFGTQLWGFEDGGLNNWARQHGDALYSDGQVSIDPETLVGWWEYLLELTESGGAPTAAATIEKQTAGLAESFSATNTAGMAAWWNSQLTALSDAAGTELQLMRVPTVDGEADGSAYYKPSMYWSVSARTEHPAEAALFLDYLANSTDVADVLLTERGVPANEAVREYLAPKLSPSDQAVVAFLDDLGEDVGEAPPITPAGGSSVEAILKQYTEQVIFGQSTPAEAADGFIRDMESAISAG